MFNYNSKIMKKNVLLLLVLITSQLAFSQGIKVISNEPISLPASEMGYNPVLSPNGDFILFTGGNLQGLHKYDLATRQLQTITTDEGAGFNAQISADGQTVVYRSTTRVNRLRFQSLQSIDLATGVRTEVLAPTRNLEGFALRGGTLVAMDNGELKVRQLNETKAEIAPVVSNRQGQLYVFNVMNRQVSPQGSEVNYLWASVSPDGKKMVYYAVELGQVFVSNVDGSNPVSLGVLRAPVWMGNDWVIGMLDEDDGSFTTASKIVAVSANGAVRQDLTDSSVIAMDPMAAANANKIVYSSNGKIYLMQVELSK
jgi:Tol biopolymer transport system component